MNMLVHPPRRAYDVVTDSNGVEHMLVVKPLIAAMWYALDGWVQ